MAYDAAHASPLSSILLLMCCFLCARYPQDAMVASRDQFTSAAQADDEGWGLMCIPREPHHSHDLTARLRGQAWEAEDPILPAIIDEVRQASAAWPSPMHPTVKGFTSMLPLVARLLCTRQWLDCLPCTHWRHPSLPCADEWCCVVLQPVL
eukprot:1157340-Pelagomonas_calceolata.AAC.11